jgi:hypothetical protein
VERRVDVEPFVARLVAGGVLLVAGTWTAVLSPTTGIGWFAGVALAFAGALLQASAVASQVEY